MTTISKNVNQGDSVSIQATPKTGYTFSGWTSGAGDSRISTDNPYTFTPNADTSINAVFSEVQPIISWVGNPGNLVIKNSNGQTRNLWSGAGTNKYYGDVEGFGADDIVSVWISGNDPDGTNSLIDHTWLTELNLSGLTHLTLGQRSFANCTTLTTVVLPTSSYSIASINGSQSNHAGAFQGCTALTSLTLGGCTSVGAYAFYECGALGTVSIPGSCTTIGTNAFTRAGISTLTLAEGVSVINNYAFTNNPSLTSVSFPSTLSSYGKSAFQGCYGLTTITMNNYSGTYYATSGNCLYEKSGRSVVLGCKTSTIPTSSWNVNKISDSAFNLMIKTGANVNLTIPSNITGIGDSAFYGCNGLTGVSFSGSSISYINGSAFRDCTGLTSITIPSITSFGTSNSVDGSYVFGGCTNLARINIVSNSTPPTLYGNEISMFPDTIKIYIKPGTMQAYQNASGWAYWYNQKKLYIGVGISSDVSPAGSSTVSTSSNNVEFQSDSAAPTVRLTATPNTGYTFSSWKRGSTVLSTSNPYNATVVDDGTGIDEFTALSTVASYSISASVNPNGGGTVSGTGTYSYGDSCTVSATSNTGYDFVNWTEDGSTVSSSASYTFTVSQARTLVANFELQTITISAGPNTSGYGTVSGNSGTYSYGDTVSLTATAASGYEFVNWTENGTAVSTSSTYSFTATQDRTLVANFAVISYTISASVDPSGSGTISGTGTYNYGASCTLVCTPATGYAFSEWTESGSTVSSTASYTFTVSGNRTLVAACQSTVPMHTITVLKGQNAELSPEYKNPTFSGGGTYPEGTTITISMTSPSTQYTVAQWYNQTETVQGNYDTWTKYSLNGHYVDSNSISYTVGDHDETIYCNVFSAGGNMIYTRHFETYSDPMMEASIPAFDCYDSNNNLLGTWTGAMDQGVNCPFTASSVYKLVNHVEYIEPEWDPGNPMPVYSNLVYLDSADFSGLINLHEIDGYGGSGGGSMYIGAMSFILPPSCTVVKNMYFGAAQLYDESIQQLMLYYPRQINFGNVETVENVEFACYNLEDPSVLVQEMTIWDGEGNYGIRQWAVSTYKLSSMTSFSIGQCYQPELYFPNLPSGSSIGAQGLPALTGDTVYMTPNITKISLQDCSGITSITIPAHIEEIGNMRCSNLASITFEGGFNSHLKYINIYAFQNCTRLTSINIPYMVAKLNSNSYMMPNIGYNAFMGCTGLTTATIGARAVDNYIFQNCTSLTSVSLPYLSTITNQGSTSLVGQGIFFGCSHLTTVRLGSYYSGYVQGVSRSWLSMALGSTSTPFWKYNNSGAYPSTITTIYYDYEDGPTSSQFINSSIPNSSFVLHIGEDAIDDGTDWSNIGNLKTSTTRLKQDL
jgi:hypothetical protein